MVIKTDEDYTGVGRKRSERVVEIGLIFHWGLQGPGFTLVPARLYSTLGFSSLHPHTLAPFNGSAIQ